MGSIVSRWAASAQRGNHEACSLVILSRADSVRELFGVVPVKPRGVTNRLTGEASAEGVVDVEKAGVVQSSKGWTPTDPGEAKHPPIVEDWASVSW